MTQEQLDKILNLNVSQRGGLNVLVSSSINIEGLDFKGHNPVQSNHVKGAILLNGNHPFANADLLPEDFYNTCEEWEQIQKSIDRIKKGYVYKNAVNPEGGTSFLYFDNGIPVGEIKL